MKIRSDMIISEVIEKHPETIEVFMGYGVHCVGCANSLHETVAQGADLHGINLEEFLEDLNDFAC